MPRPSTDYFEHGGVGHEKQRVLNPGLPSPFDSCHVVKHPPNLRAGDADRVDVDARDYAMIGIELKESERGFRFDRLRGAHNDARILRNEPPIAV
jgi:hypothetical protein